MLVLGNGVNLVRREVAKADQVFETNHRSLRPLKSVGLRVFVAPALCPLIFGCVPDLPNTSIRVLFQRCRKFQLGSWCLGHFARLGEPLGPRPLGSLSPVRCVRPAACQIAQRGLDLALLDLGRLTHAFERRGRVQGRAKRTMIAGERAADLRLVIAGVRASGASSLRQIAAGLNQRGISTPGKTRSR
jgi:hypothetical protein